MKKLVKLNNSALMVNENLENSLTLKNKVKKQLIIKICVFCVLTTICLVSICFSNSLEPYINFNYFNSVVLQPKNCKVHFIDVGQGDCTVLELPNGKVVMIDTGPEGQLSKINTYFKFLKIPKQIDYLILTHTDSDHIGNATNIINNYNVKQVYMPKVYSNYEVENNLIKNSEYKIFNSKLWNEVCCAIHSNCSEQNIFYNECGLTIQNSENTFCLKFYSPLENFYEEDNNYSPIIHFRVYNQQLLFMADASKNMEEEFLQNFSQEIEDCFNIKLLKVAHHGSKNSSSKKFIEKLNPAISVISCGKDNLYAHPANETINVLNSSTVLRTDVNNSIMFYCNASLETSKTNWGVNYNYENFNNVYIHIWQISVTVILLLFFAIVLPVITSKKIKIIFSKN